MIVHKTSNYAMPSLPGTFKGSCADEFQPADTLILLSSPSSLQCLGITYPALIIIVDNYSMLVPVPLGDKTMHGWGFIWNTDGNDNC